MLTANPEPYAAFFDVVLLGDGEDMLANFLNAYSSNRLADVRNAGGGNAARLELLQALAQVLTFFFHFLSLLLNTCSSNRLADVRNAGGGNAARLELLQALAQVLKHFFSIFFLFCFMPVQATAWWMSEMWEEGTPLDWSSSRPSPRY